MNNRIMITQYTHNKIPFTPTIKSNWDKIEIALNNGRYKIVGEDEDGWILQYEVIN